MKLSAIVENDENMVVIPLIWLDKEDHRAYIRFGYEVIPISGYQETRGFRAFKIIGPFSDDNYWIKELSIPIWEDWKLTARYATNIEKAYSTTGQQMFDRLDDDEKINTLKYNFINNTNKYISKYFRDHPDLLKRARKIISSNNLARWELG